MTVQERVIDVIHQQLGSDQEITEETNFEEFGVDSLDRVEIVMELEEEFDINIPDDAAEKFKNVGDVVRYIASVVDKETA